MIDIAKRIGKKRMELAEVQSSLPDSKEHERSLKYTLWYKAIIEAGGIKELGPTVSAQEISLERYLRADDEWPLVVERVIDLETREIILQAELESLLDERRELEFNYSLSLAPGQLKISQREAKGE